MLINFKIKLDESIIEGKIPSIFGYSLLNQFMNNLLF